MPCAQEPANGSYPKSDESTVQSHNALFKINFNNILPSKIVPQVIWFISRLHGQNYNLIFMSSI